MATHLIIDGYNLIRQSPELLAQESLDLRWGREALLEKLAAYRRLKPNPITVVFDGWESGEIQGNRDRYQGILIIYSRRGEKADEVIKGLADRERERGLIISSDRELINHAQRVGAGFMSAADFFFQLAAADASGDPRDSGDGEGSGRGTKKKGPAHRASKKIRRQRRRTKKI